MKTVCQLVAVLAVLGLGINAARAQSIQPGTISAQLKLIATVTNSANGGPTFGVHSPDPRFLYVGQQNGTIRILNLTQPTPLLDPPNFLNFDAVLGAGLLVDDTGTGERGLLGAAFHPDFNNDGRPRLSQVLHVHQRDDRQRHAALREPARTADGRVPLQQPERDPRVDRAGAQSVWRARSSTRRLPRAS